MLAVSARASTTISANGTFTIDNSNTALSGTTRTWNDTGTLTMSNGAVLQTWPSQTNTVVNNDAIVLAGATGTISFRYNGNDSDFMMNGASVTSTATGAQTLAIHTGYSGNGDRESVTFNAGIPNATGGSVVSLSVTFKTQTGSQSWVNLNAVNTFTGPISLVQGSGGPATGYLTIGGTLTKNNGNTFGTGTLGGGNYAGAIALGTSTILNYASSAPQTLAGVISGVGAVQVTGTGTLTLSGVNTYTGTTTVNAGRALVLGSGGGLKFVVSDASNNKVTGGGTATLNGTFTVDTSAVTVTFGVWTLVDVSTKSFGATFGLAGFTGPVSNVFTKVAGGQVWTFSTATGVLSLISKAIITSFGIPGSVGVINQTSKTIALTVPYGTSLATLAPTFAVTSGSCNQTSGLVPSPTFAAANPGHYIVTDGAVVNDYTVTISVTSPSSNKDVLACDFGVFGAATISGTSITLTVPVGTVVTSLTPNFTLSPFSTISPSSGVPQNFTNPVTYTVTAQDGTTKAYTVTVQSYLTWTYSGPLFILTTPEGANLPAGSTETNFPLLVRFNSSNFNFGQAQSDGRDIRFTTLAGASLPYQIEQWDSVNGTAAVWVKIPTITGNARQEIKMYWGKAGVTSESSGAAVFNAANGYASVLHLNEAGTVTDSVGTVTATQTGTTQANGMIGQARNFSAGNGIHCGDNITAFAQGGTAHSTGAWFRASAVNCDIVDWGMEGGGFNKVQVRIASPPHMYVDGNFASVTGTTTLDTTQWHHVVHTYSPGSPNVARIYVDGQLDGSANVTMNLPNPSRMWIGGWYGNYSYAGDIDEVRISKVARSANWIKLEYENQKPLQTLVGILVQAGSTFSVSPPLVTMNEGTSTTLAGQAGGAQKVYWIRKQNGVDTLLAVDQFSLNLAAGRVTGNQSYVIQFQGIYPTGIQTVDVPVTVIEDLPDPIFTLSGPSAWDGRQTIAVTSVISNLSTLQAKGVANFTYKWSVNGVAVTKQITPGTLTLLRAQGNGPMTVTLTMDNGGIPVTVTKTIAVQQPTSDPWLQRTPDANEKPVNNQFYARDDTGFGRIYYNGTQSGADPVFLKVYTTDTGSDVLYATHRQALSGGAYSFTAPIAAGKVTYKVVYGTTTGGVDAPVGIAITNLVCGDAYIIEGQSNALATDNSEPSDPTVYPWIRSYGKTVGWGYAINKGSELELGVWGMILARRLSTYANMPIGIINGAVGGTRIDQHQPNPANHSVAGSLYSIYANLYNRVVGAKLTHGIRAVLWHQGEQDQGSGGPDGDYDYKFYQQYFVDMSAAWKQDFPNIKNYYVFQIWPGACGDTSRNDQLREVQRTLPYLYSNMKPMSTLGIIPGSGCHYVLAGYQVFSDLLGPLLEQDVYGRNPAEVHTAPDLKRAYFTNATRNRIALEFSQSMNWNTGAPGLFYLSGEAVPATVSSGSVGGSVIELQLNKTSSATTITYVKGLNSWSQNNILKGTNGLAALTFADVSIGPPVPTGLAATAGDSQVALNWAASAGATGYKVKRATTSGGPYTVIGAPTGVTYTDTTVTNGTPYYYVVAATTDLGEGVDSAQVTATPSAPLSSAKDILTFVFPGLPATTISGTNITVTVPFGTNVTALAPAFTQSPLATVAPISGTVRNFSGAQTYTVTAQNLSTQLYTVTVTVAPSPYATWAAAPAQGLTAGANDGPLHDPERDGISNVLEFILGGAPMASSAAVLPKLTSTLGNWAFEYDRSAASLSSTTQVVEYGSDFSGWTAIPVTAASGGPVTVTPGGATDHIRVAIPAGGGKQFVRLKVTQ